MGDAVLSPDEVQPPHYAESRGALFAGETAQFRDAEAGLELADSPGSRGVGDTGLIYLIAPNPAAPEALAGAREAVVDWLGGDVSDDLAADLELIVSELVTNALRSAATMVRVTAERRTDRVEVRVYDDGPGWPRPLTPAPSANHGRGLQIVAALSDRWGVTAETAGGKTVWAGVAIPA